MAPDAAMATMLSAAGAERARVRLTLWLPSLVDDTIL